MKNNAGRISIMGGLFAALLMITALYSTGPAGCGTSTAAGGGGGGTGASGDLGSVTVSSSSVADGSDFTPNVSFYAGTGGGLGIRCLGSDVDGDGTVGTPSVSSVSVASGDTISLSLPGAKSQTFDDGTCDFAALASGDDAPLDLLISLDTTGSMGGAASVIAAEIADFAVWLESEGFDVRFGAVTVGDAFATKLATGSAYTSGEGALGEPPTFDSVERPDAGVSLVTATDAGTFFDAVAASTSTGTGGDGSEENYIGALNFLQSEITGRAGATRVLISVGDDCAHTPDSVSYEGITGDWIPPTPATFIASLDGAPVHVITDTSLTCSDPYYDMQDLANETGGTIVDKGSCSTADSCNVSLETLPIGESLGNAIGGECDITIGELTTLTVTVVVTMSDGGTTYTATISYVITVTPTS